MRTEIKTEIIIHPIAGELTKKYIYTYDDNNVVKNKQLYVEPGITPAAFNSRQDNYNPSGLENAQVLRLAATGAQLITGIAAPMGEKTLKIINIGIVNITLVNASVYSSPANRFSHGANFVLNNEECVDVWYDTISSRWRIVSN